MANLMKKELMDSIVTPILRERNLSISEVDRIDFVTGNEVLETVGYSDGYDNCNWSYLNYNYFYYITKEGYVRKLLSNDSRSYASNKIDDYSDNSTPSNGGVVND